MLMFSFAARVCANVKFKGQVPSPRVKSALKCHSKIATKDGTDFS